MKFQAFHVNPGEKLKKKDVDNDLSNFKSVFPTDPHPPTWSRQKKTQTHNNFSSEFIGAGLGYFESIVWRLKSCRN